MDIEAHRDLKLLEEVAQNSRVTQRSLASKLGIALGLTNIYLRRLARIIAAVDAPASGEVIEINPALEDAPESINNDPYAAWLFRIKLSNAAELATLLDAVAYEKAVG